MGKQPRLKAPLTLTLYLRVQLFGNELKKEREEAHPFGLLPFLSAVKGKRTLSLVRRHLQSQCWQITKKERQQSKAQTINFPGESMLLAWRARVTFH